MRRIQNCALNLAFDQVVRTRAQTCSVWWQSILSCSASWAPKTVTQQVFAVALSLPLSFLTCPPALYIPLFSAQCRQSAPCGQEPRSKRNTRQRSDPQTRRTPTLPGRKPKPTPKISNKEDSRCLRFRLWVWGFSDLGFGGLGFVRYRYHRSTRYCQETLDQSAKSHD